MALGRSRYQKGRVVSTEAGGWEIHYNVYVTDPATGKPKRRHRSRVVGYPPKMRKAETESILAAELAAVNGGPITPGRRNHHLWRVDAEFLHPHARCQLAARDPPQQRRLSKKTNLPAS